MSNISRTRLVGGKLDVIIAASSASGSCSILRAVPSPRIESKTEGNVHALVRIPELEAEGTFESRLELQYATSNRSFKLEQGLSSVNLAQSTDSYCRNDKFWEIKDPLVRRTSEDIRSSSNDVAEFLLRAFAWVRDHVKLRQPEPKRFGAAHTIRELTGESRPFDWHAWAEVQVSGDVWIPFDPSLNFFAAISDRHLARCCMGRQSDYPLRRLTWRSQPERSPTMNDDDFVQPKAHGHPSP